MPDLVLMSSVSDITSDAELRQLIAKGRLRSASIPSGLEEFPEAVRYMKELVNIVYPAIKAGDAMHIIHTARSKKLNGDMEKHGLRLYETGWKVVEKNTEAICKRMADIESEIDEHPEFKREHVIFGELLSYYLSAYNFKKDPEEEYKLYMTQVKGGSDAQ